MDLIWIGIIVISNFELSVAMIYEIVAGGTDWGAVFGMLLTVIVIDFIVLFLAKL